MTYPVDDLGNPRVDFVWGQFPLQPNDQRTRTDVDGANITTDTNWTVTKERGSSNLNSGWTTLSFGTGDGGNTREQTFTFDSHEIAVDNYENYPSFTRGIPYDDTIPNRVVPNLIGLTIEQADAALSNLELSSDAHTTTVGATSGNDGEVASQVPAPGTLVNMQDEVLFTTYHYVATSGTVPNIEGMTESAAIAALAAAGFTDHNNDGSATNVDGATALNDGKVKQGTTGVQLFASTIHYWTYNYTAPATTGPISGFNRLSGTSFSLNGSDAIMYLTGRTVKPTLGDTITVSGTTASAWNQTWLVAGVEDNDSYNSGGTAVKITAIDDIYFAGESGVSSTGGTWTKI